MGIETRYFSTGRYGQQIDFCLRIRAFQGAYDGERENQVTNQVQANDQDTFGMESGGRSEGIAVPQSSHPEATTADAQKQVDDRAYDASAGANDGFTHLAARTGRHGIAIVINVT